MVNKTEKSVEFTKGIFSTHKYSLSVEIIDCVKYVYCIFFKTRLQFSSEETIK